VPDNLLVTGLKAFVLVNLLMAFFAFMTWLERRLIGRFQQRYGPNRVGPGGLLQPIADLVKLIRKQSAVPEGARPRLFLLAPFISLFCAIAAFGLMPFGGTATCRSRTGRSSSTSPTRPWRSSSWWPSGRSASTAC
jgi:NADH-quinone oxidoreductase subunit H